MKTSNGTGAYHHGLFGRPTIHMAKEGGAGGSGGNDDDDDDDDGINEEAFGKMFNKFFHKAFGEREKRFEQKVMKNLETTLGTKFDEIKTMIGEAAPKNEEKAKAKGEETPGNAKLPPEIQAQIAQMAKDAKEAKELASKYQKEAEEQKGKSRRTEEKNELTKMLTGAVKPALLDMVVGQLHGNIARDDESGAILWKGSDGELLPLKDGIESWKKSDAGKEVAPPRQAGGSGSTGGGGAPTRPGDFGLADLGGLLTGSMRTGG